MTGSNYRDDINDMFDYMKDDVGTIIEEIDTLLDMTDIEDIKIHLSDLKNTAINLRMML